ncbi:hypothetical protein L596_009256 [Steinernema carpocapsae]|uniref:Uncharacterized protein n=1 Tax=Steinernema carpocapsae TaxID=34508 RepID=A0A4U5PFC7_STECR|nr:hypothetical protein L596_009256 [Steinernema carpocapsae]
MVSSQKKLTWSGHIIWTSTHFLYDLCTLEKFYTTPFISLAVPTCFLTTAELIPTNSNGFPDLAAFMGMQPSSQGSKNVQDKLNAESGSSVQSKVDIDISR